MSARSKVQKSLGIGAYAPQVFTPSANGEHIRNAVETLGLTAVTICGETVTANVPPAPKPQPEPKLPSIFFNVSEYNGTWYVDFVWADGVQAIAHRDTRQAALSLAKRRAKRLGLTVHQGAYVWEAAA